jgi:hypothetical protein
VPLTAAAAEVFGAACAPARSGGSPPLDPACAAAWKESVRARGAPESGRGELHGRGGSGARYGEVTRLPLTAAAAAAEALGDAWAPARLAGSSPPDAACAAWKESLRARDALRKAGAESCTDAAEVDRVTAKLHACR